VTNFQNVMDKLRSDSDIEMLSVRKSMEGVCEKVDELLIGHIEETDRRTGRILEELKVKENILEIWFTKHVKVTTSDIQ